MKVLLTISVFLSLTVFAQDFSFTKGTLVDIFRQNATFGYKTGFSYGFLTGNRNLLILGPELSVIRRETNPIIIYPINPPNVYNKTFESRSLLTFPVHLAINTSNKPYQNVDFFMKYGAHFGVQISSCVHSGFFHKCIFDQINASNSFNYNMGFTLGFEIRYYLQNKSYFGFNFGGRMHNIFNDQWYSSSSLEFFHIEAGLRYGFNFVSKTSK